MQDGQTGGQFQGGQTRWNRARDSKEVRAQQSAPQTGSRKTHQTCKTGDALCWAFSALLLHLPLQTLPQVVSRVCSCLPAPRGAVLGATSFLRWKLASNTPRLASKRWLVSKACVLWQPRRDCASTQSDSGMSGMLPARWSAGSADLKLLWHFSPNALPCQSQWIKDWSHARRSQRCRSWHQTGACSCKGDAEGSLRRFESPALSEEASESLDAESLRASKFDPKRRDQAHRSQSCVLPWHQH